MARISVIVPVYNTEKLLRRCIDSILSQTFTDFDLILVDDGSKDSSGAICDTYGEKDSRVHVIHQKNSGVGVARNTGLAWVMENSDSQWIAFVDSDDWTHPSMLELLLKIAESFGTNISACGFLETENGSLEVTEDQLEPQLWDAPVFYDHQPILGTVPWGKLYARKCFETIRYPVGTYFDDEFVTYRLLFAEKSIAYVPAPLYAYYINLAGLTKRTWIPRRMDVWKAYEEQITFFNLRGDAVRLRSRYREYIDNSYGQLLEVQRAIDISRKEYHIRSIKKSLRALIRRAWKLGYIEFWMDYDMLYACAPVRTKLYRVWLELKNK